MIHHQINALLIDGGAQMFDRHSQDAAPRAGWIVEPAERFTHGALIKWCSPLTSDGGETYEPIPTITSSTQLTIVCKILAYVGYGWQLENRIICGEMATLLHVRPQDTGLAQRIIEHVAQMFAGMRRAPPCYGSREAREITCIDMLTMRHLVSGQEAMVEDVLPAWTRAANKVRGEVSSAPLFVIYEHEPEEVFMAALMRCVYLTKKRLPITVATLRAYEKQVEQRILEEERERQRRQSVGGDRLVVDELDDVMGEEGGRWGGGMSCCDVERLLEGRDLVVEVVHDDHRARFRPATAQESRQYMHFGEQVRMASDAMERVVLEGGSALEYRRALPSHWDGNAMRPCGVELVKDSVWVCGIDENGEAKWINCKQCIAMGGEAIEKIERDQVELLSKWRISDADDLIKDLR